MSADRPDHWPNRASRSGSCPELPAISSLDLQGRRRTQPGSHTGPKNWLLVRQDSARDSLRLVAGMPRRIWRDNPPRLQGSPPLHLSGFIAHLRTSLHPSAEHKPKESPQSPVERQTEPGLWARRRARCSVARFSFSIAVAIPVRPAKVPLFRRSSW